jgi:hypothetical protein
MEAKGFSETIVLIHQPLVTPPATCRKYTNLHDIISKLDSTSNPARVLLITHGYISPMGGRISAEGQLHLTCASSCQIQENLVNPNYLGGTVVRINTDNKKEK